MDKPIGYLFPAKVINEGNIYFEEVEPQDNVMLDDMVLVCECSMCGALYVDGDSHPYAAHPEED